MILSAAEMRRVEGEAFKSGISAEFLMDQVGEQIAEAVRQFFPEAGRCAVCIGKGNNGGDALVAARHLVAAGWGIELHPAFGESDLGDLPRKKLAEVRPFISAVGKARRPFVVLDGLLGLGFSGSLRDPIRSAARRINELRRLRDAYIFAIDYPTGLDSESGRPDPDAVEADFTLAAGFAKTALVADAATRHVGRIVVLPLEALNEGAGRRAANTDRLATGAALSAVLPRRGFNSHKTMFGRIAIVAGTRGTIGAAVLAAGGALHAGGGLVTVYACEDAYPLIAATAAPEIMVKPVASYRQVLDEKHDVLALGPGLGTEQAGDVLHVIEHDSGPMVLDADGLNILSKDIALLRRCAGPRLLTPHPGEMNRLCVTKDLSRHALAESFALEYPVTLLLKGARTIVAEKGGRISYNTTGNPGMSSGGMGDVLTGVCASLIGQGLPLFDAARAGAWLCGRAAELAVFEDGQSQESLSATHLFGTLGRAFSQMRAGCY